MKQKYAIHSMPIQRLIFVINSIFEWSLCKLILPLKEKKKREGAAICSFFSYYNPLRGRKDCFCAALLQKEEEWKKQKKVSNRKLSYQPTNRSISVFTGFPKINYLFKIFVFLFCFYKSKKLNISIIC